MTFVDTPFNWRLSLPRENVNLLLRQVVLHCGGRVFENIRNEGPRNCVERQSPHDAAMGRGA